MLHTKSLPILFITTAALIGCNQDLSIQPDPQPSLNALAKEGEVTSSVVLASASATELGGGFYEIQVILKGKPSEDLVVTTTIDGKDVLPTHTKVKITGTAHFVDDWQGETGYLKYIVYNSGSTTVADLGSMTYDDTDTKPWEWTSSSAIYSKPIGSVAVAISSAKSGKVVVQSDIKVSPRSASGITTVFSPTHARASKGGPDGYLVWTESFDSRTKNGRSPESLCRHGRCIVSTTDSAGVTAANIFKKFEPIYSLDLEPSKLKSAVSTQLCGYADPNQKLTSVDTYIKSSLASSEIPELLAIPRFGGINGDPVLFSNPTTLSLISGCTQPVAPEDNSDIQLLSAEFKDHGAGIGSVTLTATYLSGTPTPKGLVGAWTFDDSHPIDQSKKVDISAWSTTVLRGKLGAPDTLKHSGTIIVNGDLVIGHAKANSVGKGSILLDMPNPLRTKEDYNKGLASCGWARDESGSGNTVFRTVPVTFTAPSSAPFNYTVVIKEKSNLIGRVNDAAQLVPADLDFSFLPEAAGKTPFLLLLQNKADIALGAPSLVFLPKDSTPQRRRVKLSGAATEVPFVTIELRARLS